MAVTPDESPATPPPPPTAGRGRRLLTIALPLILLVGVGLIVAYWYFMVTNLRTAALEWIALRRAEGWRIDVADVTRSGLPLHARLEFADVSVTAPRDEGSLGWSSAGVDASLPLLGSQTLRVTATGAQTLSVPVAGGERRYRGQAREAALVMTPDGWAPTGTIVLRGLEMAPPEPEGRFALESLTLSASGDPAIAPADAALPSYRVVGELANLDLPAEVNPPLGNRVARLAVDAKLIGALAAEPWPQALLRWRDNGGTLEIAALAFGYGPLAVEADGTFALDKQGQPIGALSARVRGLQTVLLDLQQRRLIEPDAAAAASSLLAMLGQQREDGQAPVTVPLTVQDQTLFVGPMPFARLPTIVW